MTRSRALASLASVLAMWGLAGMSCEVGSARNPTGTGHQAYRETWTNGTLSSCELTNDSGIEAAGITTDWNPCGRRFRTGVTGLTAFAGQAIGAAEADAAQRNFAAGVQTGVTAVTPLLVALCAGADLASGLPALAVLCGTVHPPTPAPDPEPSESARPRHPVRLAPSLYVPMRAANATTLSPVFVLDEP